MKQTKPITQKELFNSSYQELDVIHVPLKFSIPSQRLLAKVKQIVQGSKSIVDIGCGSGATLEQFNLLNSNCNLTGIDYSDIGLKKAKALLNYHPRLELIDADMSKYILPSSYYDFAYSSQLLEHLPDPEKFLKNIYNSLKPNGQIFLATVYRPPHAWYIYHNKLGQRVLAPDHINEYTDTQVLFDQLQKSGFILEDFSLNVFHYPLIDPFIKLAMKKFGGPRLTNFLNNKFISQFRSWSSVPILGFYNFQIIARRKA